MLQPSVSRVSILKFSHNQVDKKEDLLAVEEPMEIRLIFGPPDNRQERTLAVTMRTPGHDFELTIGFLLNEGIIQRHKDIINIRHCEQHQFPEAKGNIIKVNLAAYLKLDWELLTRNFYTTSSCGICGKASIEAVNAKVCKNIITNLPPLPLESIINLPEKLISAQPIFTYTGGLHAASIFNSAGKLLLSREDIGRHNAVDKVIGAATAQNILLQESILFLSGRAGFELIQKARMVGIPIIAAVGAPSSLAVAFAKENNMTLIGFLRNERFNIYSGEHNIRLV